MARNRRSFSAEYKAEVVGLIRNEEKSASGVARDLGLSASSVRSWLAQSDVDANGGDGETLATTEREELTRLRRENRQLRMERDILKKATAFFAKEST